MTTETPDFVDALPLVDNIIDQDEQQRDEAMRLVDDELEIYPPNKDYIEYLPDISHRPFTTSFLIAEHERIEREGADANCDATHRLAVIDADVPTPAHANLNDEELELWDKCLNQIKIKLEYRQRQLSNLDLFKTYGAPAWEQFIKQNEMMEANMKQELEEIRNKIQEVNSLRKTHQETTLKNLDILQSEWDNLSIKNEMLFEEIEKLKPLTREK